MFMLYEPQHDQPQVHLQEGGNTRLAPSESVRMGSEFHCKLGITERSFMTRATCAYNQLPADLIKIPKVETFKLKLKEWVQENCTI